MLDRSYARVVSAFNASLQLGLIDASRAHKFKTVTTGTDDEARRHQLALIDLELETPGCISELKLAGFDPRNEVSRKLFLERMDRLAETVEWINDSYQREELLVETAKHLLSLVDLPSSDLMGDEADDRARLTYIVIDRLREDIGAIPRMLDVARKTGMVAASTIDDILLIKCLATRAERALQLVSALDDSL